MKKLLTVVFLLFTISCSSGTKLPMASFLVKVANPQESNAIGNKVRAYLLANGYVFGKDQSANSKSYYYPLKAEEKISVIVTENSSKGFVEVVFFQERKHGFSNFAASKYQDLKSGIRKSVGDHEIVESIAFTPGTKGSNEASMQQSLATKQWLVTMNALMPNAFCSDGHPFRRNYSGTDGSCKGHVRALMEKCMNGPMRDSPQTLHSKREAELLGESLGTCVFAGSKTDKSGEAR